MTSHQMPEKGTTMKLASGSERREHRRHDLETQQISVERIDGSRRGRERLGQLVDISAGGVRIRTRGQQYRADSQVRVRLELPDYAGISPFVETHAEQMHPKREWTGWLTISRVKPIGADTFDVAGRLVDMEEVDRGMLSLYLSTQPLAA